LDRTGIAVLFCGRTDDERSDVGQLARDNHKGRAGFPGPHQSTEAVDNLGENLTAGPVKLPQQLLTRQVA
jgi:hypothetical protein